MAASPNRGRVDAEIRGLTRPGNAAHACARLGSHRMFLAGGRTPESVAEAIALIQPDVVDVSSRVERLPEVRDPAKVAHFMEAVVGHHPTT